MENTTSDPKEQRQARLQARKLPTAEVVRIIREAGLQAHAKVVGVWVWVSFAERPSKAVRELLLTAGFHWNKERKSWQHPCGHFAKRAPYDPREKYQSIALEEVAA